MDKYKTSQLGQALKKVFRGQMSVDESVKLAQAEIQEVFDKKSDAEFVRQSDTGFFGDEIGKCPLCGGIVKRFKYNYGCSEYKNGCNFSIPLLLCKRSISVSNATMLLLEGKSSKIKGFISKKNTPFDSYLVIQDGKCVFNFDM